MKYSDFYTQTFRISSNSQIADKILLFFNAVSSGLNPYLIIPLVVNLFLAVLPSFARWVMSRKYHFSQKSFKGSRDCISFIAKEIVDFSIDPPNVRAPSNVRLAYGFCEGMEEILDSDKQKVRIEFRHGIYFWSKEESEFFAESKEYASSFSAKKKSEELEVVRYSYRKDHRNTESEDVDRDFSFNPTVYPSLPRIMKALEAWQENIEKYKQLGNSKLTLLLHGPPGCGKTSMAYAIAKHLGYKKICMATLNPKGIFEFPEDSETVIVFDDPDVLTSYSREEGVARNEFDQKRAEALDSFMKFLDSGRCPKSVVIITTNYPERFDPALFRAGRVNLKVELTSLPVENVIAFVKDWYKVDELPASLLSKIQPVTFATLCDQVRQYICDFDGFCQNYESL